MIELLDDKTFHDIDIFLRKDKHPGNKKITAEDLALTPDSEKEKELEELYSLMNGEKPKKKSKKKNKIGVATYQRIPTDCEVYLDIDIDSNGNSTRQLLQLVRNQSLMHCVTILRRQSSLYSKKNRDIMGEIRNVFPAKISISSTNSGDKMSFIADGEYTMFYGEEEKTIFIPYIPLLMYNSKPYQPHFTLFVPGQSFALDIQDILNIDQYIRNHSRIS